MCIENPNTVYDRNLMFDIFIFHVSNKTIVIYRIINALQDCLDRLHTLLIQHTELLFVPASTNSIHR